MRKSGLLLLGITAVLWIWLEYYNSSEHSFIRDAKSSLKYADGPSDKTEGDLVFTLGHLKLANSTIEDPDLQLAFTAARLRRSVEMYQWQKRSTGDFESYDSVWSTSRISDYNYSWFYSNPTWDSRLSTKVILNPSEASVNGFVLPSELLYSLSREVSVPPSMLSLPQMSSAVGLLMYSDSYYIYLTSTVRSGSPTFYPYIGDYRVHYSVVSPDIEVAAAGKQANQNLELWNQQVLLLSDTAKDSDSLLDALTMSSSFMWFMRVVFGLAIFFGGYLTHSKGSSLC
jgi:hypothetical protein